MKSVRRGELVGVIFALFHICISFYVDYSFFKSDIFIKNPIYFFCKLAACIAICFFWILCFRSVWFARHGNRHALLVVKNFLLYFGIMFFFLLLTWPGIWRNDEAGLLAADMNLSFYGWHHWLTDFFYIFSLCILAFPTGIVLIQITIICLITSYAITNAQEVFGKKALLLYIPLLFPSVIDNNLYPLRASMITFLEFFMIFDILFTKIKSVSLDNWRLVRWGVIISIIATWRSEGIYYIILPLILLFLFTFKKTFRKKLIGMWIGAVVLVFGINNLQGRMNLSITYSLSPIIGHLSAILENDFTEDEKSIVYSVFPEAYGSNFSVGFFQIVVNERENMDPNFSTKVQQLKKLFVSKIAQHPITFLKDCLRTFNKTSFAYLYPDIVPDIMAADASSAFDEGYLYNTLATNPHGNYVMHMPLNKELRKCVIRFLECRNLDNYYDIKAGSLFFYNVFPSIIMLVCIIVLSAIKRNPIFCLLSLFTLARAGVVFLSAPTTYFMYYMPVFLNGWIILELWILFYCDKNPKDMKQDNTEVLGYEKKHMEPN